MPVVYQEGIESRNDLDVQCDESVVLTNVVDVPVLESDPVVNEREFQNMSHEFLSHYFIYNYYKFTILEKVLCNTLVIGKRSSGSSNAVASEFTESKFK